MIHANTKIISDDDEEDNVLPHEIAQFVLQKALIVPENCSDNEYYERLMHTSSYPLIQRGAAIMIHKNAKILGLGSTKKRTTATKTRTTQFK